MKTLMIILFVLVFGGVENRQRLRYLRTIRRDRKREAYIKKANWLVHVNVPEFDLEPLPHELPQVPCPSCGRFLVWCTYEYRCARCMLAFREDHRPAMWGNISA